MEKSRDTQGHGACEGELNQELQEPGCAEVPREQRPHRDICSNSDLLNITKYSAYIFTLKQYSCK